MIEQKEYPYIKSELNHYQLAQELLQEEKLVFEGKDDQDKNYKFELSFSLDRTSDDKLNYYRIDITYENENKQDTGDVVLTVKKIPNPTSATVYKGWHYENNFENNIEQLQTRVGSKGIIKLATMLIMIILFEKQGIDAFVGSTSGIVDDHFVINSRPNGQYGPYSFKTSYDKSTKIITTTVKKEDE